VSFFSSSDLPLGQLHRQLPRDASAGELVLSDHPPPTSASPSICSARGARQARVRSQRLLLPVDPELGAVSGGGRQSSTAGPPSRARLSRSIASAPTRGGAGAAGARAAGARRAHRGSHLRCGRAVARCRPTSLSRNRLRARPRHHGPATRWCAPRRLTDARGARRCLSSMDGHPTPLPTALRRSSRSILRMSLCEIERRSVRTLRAGRGRGSRLRRKSPVWALCLLLAAPVSQIGPAQHAALNPLPRTIRNANPTCPPISRACAITETSSTSSIRLLILYSASPLLRLRLPPALVPTSPRPPAAAALSLVGGTPLPAAPLRFGLVYAPTASLLSAAGVALLARGDASRACSISAWHAVESAARRFWRPATGGYLVPQLEVHALPASAVAAHASSQSPREPPFESGLRFDLPFKFLETRIAARVDAMLAAGFVDETRALRARTARRAGAAGGVLRYA